MPAVLVTGHSYCYAELAVSSLAVAVTMASTQHAVHAYPRRDGQAELVGVAARDPPGMADQGAGHTDQK